MGVENTWTDDEFVVPPIPDLPMALPLAIPLPAPSTSVDVTGFGDGTNPNAHFEELECLFSREQAIDVEEEKDPLSGPSLRPTQSFSVSHSSPSATLIFDAGVVGCGEPGVCGLRNLGNTCFMGAGIQCLVATAPIALALFNAPHSHHHQLTNTIADLTKKMWSGQFISIQPMKFKSALAAHFPQFNDFRQHDCQEFLALLLDGLHDQLNTATGKGTLGLLQCENRDIRDNHGVPSKDGEMQSTSKGKGSDEKENMLMKDDDDRGGRGDETELIKELVSEVNAKEKRCNLLRKSSEPEPYIPLPLPLPGGAESSSLDADKHLNNMQMASGIHQTHDQIDLLNNPVDRITNITGIDDILKEAKTSNVNVLVTKEESNNELRFDSEKYPRVESSSRRKGEMFSVNSLNLCDNNSCGKRQSTLSNIAFSVDFQDGLDLKRVKLHSSPEEKNKRMEVERQQRSPDLLLDKNERMECERKESKEDIREDSLENTLLSPNPEDLSFDKTSEAEADSHWKAHLADNKSVVVNTFQGQFKSTVVCSVCKFISVTYEPFMYLSVPLPNAMQKKLRVTFIGKSLKHPTEFLLELNKYDTVNYLKDQILIKIGCEVKSPIMIAEVFDHHIAKVLEDHQLIRYLNDSDRSLYAFEVATLLDKSTVEPIEDVKVEEYLVATSCIICLEDKDTNMKEHDGCTCILCDSCIAASCVHYGGATFDCPVCRKEISPQIHLKPIKPQITITARMINVPIVFRLDLTGDGNNNQKKVKLFGHPMLVRTPNHCTAESLQTAIAALIPYSEPYRLLLVDGQGLHCSRCLFNSHCRGCELPSEVSLYTSDSIAIAFNTTVKVLPTTSSLALLSSQGSSLTLYDCIQAFSQSEVLDGNNPWFCPQCKQSRCATKTLSVWRYPDFLIVYLKRFVFHNHISTKLEEKVLFPLTGLSLASGPDYDLYACVCHIGGVSAGHYTTYTQHPYTQQWHYFNDSFVSKQSPLEEDYSNAYILFYKKQGLQPPSLDSINGILLPAEL